MLRTIEIVRPAMEKAEPKFTALTKWHRMAMEKTDTRFTALTKRLKMGTKSASRGAKWVTDCMRHIITGIEVEREKQVLPSRRGEAAQLHAHAVRAAPRGECT